MDWTFNYIAITNEVENAKILDSCGIQQLMVDAENLGKAERQAGKNAVINFHQIEDVKKIKNIGLKAKIICRINGFHNEIGDEIESAIGAGADILMLPMILSLDNFKKMVKKIDARVEILPLIETPYSIFKLKEIIEIAKPNQLHFGLNDLHLSLGMKNLFEILVSPLFAAAVSYTKSKVDLIGIGGIGDPFVKQKISPDLLINEFKILGSQSTILSRSFFTQGYNHNRILNSLNILENLILGEQEQLKHIELIEQVEKF